MKVWLKEGKFGKPINAFCLLRSAMPEIAWFGSPIVKARTWWLDPQKSPGGGWIDHAIYYVDMLRWLFDSEVVRVSGEIGNLKHPNEPLEDFGLATLVFQNKAVASIEVTWITEFNGVTSGFQLAGTDGQFLSDTTMKGDFANIQMETNAKRITYTDAEPGWQAVTVPAGQAEMTSHMLQVLRGEAEPIANQYDAYDTLATCLAFYEAARGLKIITL